MHRIPCEKLALFSKNDHCECGHLPGWSLVHFSDKSQYFPTDLQKTQNSEILCYLPTAMHGVFDNSGNHSLNGQQFKTQWTDTNTSPKSGPLAQNIF